MITLIFLAYTATLVRVVDGDTIEMDVQLWPGLTQRVKVRVRGIDTPEKRTRVECERKLGKAATEYTQSVLGGEIELSGIRLGKYAGRVISDVSVDGEDLAEMLIESGHARLYFGGRRERWC